MLDGIDPAMIDAFIAEDTGRGDITTEALGNVGHTRVTAHVVPREGCVIAGLAEASSVFARCGAKCEHRANDGESVEARAAVLVVRGPAAAVLRGERVALNLLMRMSGIATLTRSLETAVAGVNPGCQIAATRKTTPGFRALEKKAVVLGGGSAHRERLDSAFLLKDNHLTLGVSIADAVARCRTYRPGVELEVEADTLEQAEEAARCGADWVLLDNMTPPGAAEAAGRVRRIRPGTRIECSGGIDATPSAVVAYAPFADRISLGRITLGARPIDIGLDFAKNL
ncbi:MAG: carboxylating nicotinate-nucleotide diphosphorylase [Thermoplasmatota archaeon]